MAHLHKSLLLFSLALLTLFRPDPASAQQDHTYVDLHSVRIFFDGSEEQVEIVFSTDGTQSCFSLLNAQDEQLNLGQVCGGGENAVVTAPRSLYPDLEIFDYLHLRSILIPIVQSGEVRPTSDMVLHSVTIIGADVELVYSKGFADCVVLRDESGQILSQFANVLCQPGSMITMVLELSDHFPTMVAGQLVKMQANLRPDLVTNTVAVGSSSPLHACVLSESKLTLNDRAQIVSTDVYAEGKIRLSYDARIIGNTMGRANAQLLDRSKIEGSLTLVGTKSGNGTVTGTLDESAPVAFQGLTDENVLDGGPDITIWHDGYQALQPGTYGNIFVHDRGRLRLAGTGVYRFTSLRFSNDTKLEVDTSGGDVDVEVQTELGTGHRFKVTNPAGEAADGSKIFFYTNDATVTLEYDSVLRGNLTAPSSKVTFRDRATVHGCVRAQEIDMGFDAKIYEN